MLTQHSARYILRLPSSLSILFPHHLLLCFKPTWQHEGCSFACRYVHLLNILSVDSLLIFPQLKRTTKKAEWHKVIMRIKRSNAYKVHVGGGIHMFILFTSACRVCDCTRHGSQIVPNLGGVV